MGIKFTVYKTKNLVNGKYYIGVHKTSSPNDSYLGSGKLIKRAIAKYGEENFRKEILFVYDSNEEAFKKEFELVEAAKQDKLCYNLRQGGSGGFDWINKKQDQSWRVRAAAITNKDVKLREKAKDRLRAAQHLGKNSLKFGMTHEEFTRLRVQPKGAAARKGKRHTKELRTRWSKERSGSANVMFGMVWFYNERLKVSKRFKNDAIPTGDWIKGRKFWKV